MSPQRFFVVPANAAFIAGTARKPKVNVGPPPLLILFFVPFFAVGTCAALMERLNEGLALIACAAIFALLLWREGHRRRRLLRDGRPVDGRFLDKYTAFTEEGNRPYPVVRYELVSPTSGARLIGSHDFSSGDRLPSEGDAVSVLYVDDDLYALL